MSDELVTLGIGEILDALRNVDLAHVDQVVAIERGGVVPGALVAAIVGCPLDTMRVRFRDDAHQPLYDAPQLLSEPSARRSAGRRVLLVDDVSVTGATLRSATEALSGDKVVTLVLRGNADHVAFPDLQGCVVWPWSQKQEATSDT